MMTMLTEEGDVRRRRRRRRAGLTDPLRFVLLLFKMAFISAWQTYGNLVSRGFPLSETLAQGKSWSVQPRGKPL